MTRDARDIIVSTGDVRDSYDILGPVYFQVSNEGVLGSQFSKLEKQYNKCAQDIASNVLVRSTAYPPAS